MLRIPRCLDSRLTIAVNLSALRTGRALFHKHFSASGIHFCYRLSKPQGLVGLEGLGKLKKSFTSAGLEPATLRFVA
jgi:hypothetical protein